MFKVNDNNRKWWTLIAMSSALALVFIDQTALAVALPAIQRELNLSTNLLQWVINAYLLALSALILLGGKLGDSRGHKLTFLFGIIIFISASLLCAIAQSGSWIVTSRAIQGLGGAFMIPSTNAIVVNAFPDKERGKAMGIYVALAAVFLALGPLLGGILTEWLGWRAVFWINFPISIISILLAVLSIPRQKLNTKLRLDYWGVVLSILFISGYVLSFMEGKNWGWSSPIILTLFFVSTLAFIAFIFWENHFPYPLVDLKIFKNPLFSLMTSTMLIIQAIGIVFVFWAIFMQSILQYSPLGAGLLLLPAVLPIIFMAPIGGHLRDKYGPNLPMYSGCLMIIFSLLWIGFFSTYQIYIALFPGLLAYGVGMPLMLSGTMTTIMSTVNDRQRGIAGAILNCARQFGASIGLAILGSFLASLNTRHLSKFLQKAPEPLAHLKENTIDGLLIKSTSNVEAIHHLSTHSLSLLKSAATNAYVYAFSMTMFAAAGLAFICLLLIRKVVK